MNIINYIKKFFSTKETKQEVTKNLTWQEIMNRNNNNRPVFITPEYINIEKYSEEEIIEIINSAIDIFEQNQELDEDKIREKITEKVIDIKLSKALYDFIPIAYSRQVFPSSKYSEEFIVFKNQNNQTRYIFRLIKLYNLINNEVSRRLQIQNKEKEIQSILNHSCEYDSIRKHLSNGGKIEDMESSYTIFLDLE